MEHLRLAVVVPYWLGQDPADSLRVALEAERLGYAEIWMGEMATLDAFALAGAVARETRRARLVVGPLPVSLRSPAALALGVTAITHLGGRLSGLALGASTPTVVTGWHGRPWPADNPGLMRTVVAELRVLLEGGRGAGGFRLRAPVPGTEIAVAAFGPRMLAVAAEVADRVVLNLVTPAAAGRLAAGLRQPATAWVPAALDPGPAAYDQLRRELVVYVGQPGYGEMLAEAGFGDVVRLARAGAHPRTVLEAIPDAMLAAVGAVGTAAEVAARVRAYHDAGVATVAVVPVTAEDPGGSRVLAALRAELG